MMTVIILSGFISFFSMAQTINGVGQQLLDRRMQGAWGGREQTER